MPKVILTTDEWRLVLQTLRHRALQPGNTTIQSQVSLIETKIDHQVRGQ